MTNKFCSAEEAMKCIQDGDVVVVTGFVNQHNPNTLLKAINDCDATQLHYWSTTGIVGSGVLDTSKFAKATASHFGLTKNFQQAISEGSVDYEIIPQGIMTKLLSQGGYGHKLTTVGKGSFLDKSNSNFTTFDAPDNFDVALIKGIGLTKQGNIVLPELQTDQVNAYISCDKVLVEVPNIVLEDCSKNKILPKVYVDHLVISGLGKEEKNNSEKIVKIIPEHTQNYVKRVVEYLPEQCEHVLLGIGLPEACADYLPKGVKQVVECGIIANSVNGGVDFGTTDDPDAEYYPHEEMFNQIENGSLDCAILGVGEFDQDGNVNVHDFGESITGVGGFLDIVQGTDNIIFCGKESKLVDNVSSITFNGYYYRNKKVYYFTEKSVYILGEDGKLQSLTK